MLETSLRVQTLLSEVGTVYCTKLLHLVIVMPQLPLNTVNTANEHMQINNKNMHITIVQKL